MSSQPGWIRVAAGRDDFQKSLGCGMCVEIKGSGKGSGSDPVVGVTKAIVHDLCGGCGKGDFHMSINYRELWLCHEGHCWSENSSSPTGLAQQV